MIFKKKSVKVCKSLGQLKCRWKVPSVRTRGGKLHFYGLLRFLGHNVMSMLPITKKFITVP